MAYILFESEDFNHCLNFTDQELRDFVELWRAGISLKNIAKKLGRKQTEIGLLIIDHAERGIITKRKSGVFGL